MKTSIVSAVALGLAFSCSALAGDCSPLLLQLQQSAASGDMREFINNGGSAQEWYESRAQRIRAELERTDDPRCRYELLSHLRGAYAGLDDREGVYRTVLQAAAVAPDEYSRQLMLFSAANSAYHLAMHDDRHDWLPVAADGLFRIQLERDDDAMSARERDMLSQRVIVGSMNVLLDASAIAAETIPVETRYNLALETYTLAFPQEGASDATRELITMGGHPDRLLLAAAAAEAQRDEINSALQIAEQHADRHGADVGESVAFAAGLLPISVQREPIRLLDAALRRYHNQKDRGHIYHAMADRFDRSSLEWSSYVASAIDAYRRADALAELDGETLRKLARDARDALIAERQRLSADATPQARLANDATIAAWEEVSEAVATALRSHRAAADFRSPPKPEEPR